MRAYEFPLCKSKNNEHRVRYGAFRRAAKMLFDRTVSKTKFCVWTNISVQSAAVKWKQDSSRVEALIIQNGMIGWLARPKSRFGLEQKCAVRIISRSPRIAAKAAAISSSTQAGVDRRTP